MKIDLMMDSGAFSAWSKGKKVSIQELENFLSSYDDVISSSINLDVIGDADGSLRNWRIMRKHGFNPIPVWHLGEDIKYLKYYLEKVGYIALGGMVGTMPTSVLYHNLDQVWDEFLTDRGGFPSIKVHGLGLTNWTLVFKYPWYSLDSSYATKQGQHGKIFMPKFHQGRPILNVPPSSLFISTQSPYTKQRGRHLFSLPESHKEIAYHFIETEMGFPVGKSTIQKVDAHYTLKEGERWVLRRKEKDSRYKEKISEVEIVEKEGLSNDWKMRMAFNIAYMVLLEEVLPYEEQRFKREDKIGFGLGLEALK